MLILNAARNRAGRTRCGFVAGKQLGKAHDRNRAKRRVREAVRLAYPYMASGWDLIFIVRAPVLDARFEVIAQVVQDLLRRAGLWLAPVATHGAEDGASNSAATHPTVPASIRSDTA